MSRSGDTVAAQIRTAAQATTVVSALALLASSVLTASPSAGVGTVQGTREAVRPIRALYVTGGGFHEFVKQEGIVPPAISERAKVAWTIDHTAGTSTNTLIERHKTTDWTNAFDVVVYNMSFSNVVDPAWIERIAAAHRLDACTKSGPHAISRRCR